MCFLFNANIKRVVGVQDALTIPLEQQTVNTLATKVSMRTSRVAGIIKKGANMFVEAVLPVVGAFNEKSRVSGVSLLSGGT